MGKIAKLKSSRVGHKELKQCIDFVLQEHKEVAQHTLGPHGKHSILVAWNKQVPIPVARSTKDGKDTIQTVKFDTPITEALNSVIWNIYNKQHKEVGDGTTTASIDVFNLYNGFEKGLKKWKRLSPKGFEVLLKNIHKVLTDEVYNNGYEKVNKNNYSTEDRLALLTKVATIAANNDPVIGEKVAESFMETDSLRPQVRLEYSNSDDIIHTKRASFTHIARAIRPNMYRSVNHTKTTFVDPYIFIVDGAIIDNDIEELKRIKTLCTIDDRPIVFLASDYNGTLIEQFFTDWVSTQKTSSMKNVHNEVMAFKISKTGLSMSNIFTDFSIILGAQLQNTVNNGKLKLASDNKSLREVMGSCGTFEAGIGEIEFLDPNGNVNELEDRLEYLEGLLKSEEVEDRIYSPGLVAALEERIAMMEKSTIVIRVGGLNARDREYNMSVMDDAVKACSAAVREGVILGGGYLIPRIIKRDMQFIIDQVILQLELDKQSVGHMTHSQLEKYIHEMLLVIHNTLTIPFQIAMQNSNIKPSVIKKINKHLLSVDEYSIYNILTDKYETLDSTNGIANVLVPRNTETTILESTFNVINYLLNAENIILPYIGDPRVHTPVKE